MDRKLTVRRLFQMSACPDGALGLVQYLCGDRSQEQAVKCAVAMGRHDDQAGVTVVSRLDDFAGRVASEQ